MKTFKRKSTLLIGIAFVVYVISVLYPSVKINDGQINVFNDYRIPILIGLAEFICAIANKKAVFVLSIIQTITTALAFVFIETVLNEMKQGGYIVYTGVFFFLPIVASILFLAGGILFRKEKAVSGGVQ